MLGVLYAINTKVLKIRFIKALKAWMWINNIS